MSALRYKITDGISHWWLTGAPDEVPRRISPALTESPSFPRAQQTAQGSDWAMVIVYDRGNQAVLDEFNVSIAFSSDMERQAFQAKLAPIDPEDALHPWEGDIIKRIEEGGEWREWTIPEAALSLAGVDPHGVIGLRLRYRVRGPGIDTNATTGTYDWLEDTEGRPLLSAESLYLGSAEHEE